MEGLRKFREAIRGWTWHHLVVFLLTFLSYASFHACRKAFSNIKDSMVKSLSPLNHTMHPHNIWQKEHMFTDAKSANVFLGELDLLFLLAYAFGLYISGIIGDRINLRYLLTFGMFGSAVLTCLFGYISVVLKIQSRIYFDVIYFFNGLFQSTGWPATVAVMGNWFSKSSGGFVFGVWSANASVGNIFGSLIVASVLDYGYEYGMMLNSMFLFCVSVITFICLIPHPNLIGLESPDKQIENNDTIYKAIGQESDTECGGSSSVEDITKEADMKNMKSEERKAIGFCQAFMIPGVLAYALAYACLKMVNYSFFFWLPTYLSQGLHWADAKSDQLSNFYDIGSIVGGIVAGVITDFMGVRSPIVSLMILLSMGSMYLYANIGSHYMANVAVMVLTGFLIGGPANTISTAITADLGKHEKIQGNAEALATVTGIIDGTGSIGAAIGQYLVGLINKVGEWHWVFNFLIIMTGLSFMCILPLLIKELRSLCNRRNSRYVQPDREKVVC